jgi:hypothetical protein
MASVCYTGTHNQFIRCKHTTCGFRHLHWQNEHKNDDQQRECVVGSALKPRIVEKGSLNFGRLRYRLKSLGTESSTQIRLEISPMSHPWTCFCTVTFWNKLNNKTSAFLGYYSAYSGNFLPAFWDNLSVSSSGVKNPPFLGFFTFDNMTYRLSWNTGKELPL